MPAEGLLVIDRRTGKEYEIPIVDGAVRAADLRAIKVAPDDPGLLSYDPGLANTATCRSRITYVDGANGILRYRGYPIEELAEKSTYLETAYLIVKGELPDEKHFEMWRRNVTTHTMVHENIKKFMDGFRYDAHPMGMLVGTLGALSTFYNDAKRVYDLESRRLQTRRLIGKMPTLAAYAYRKSLGLRYVSPDNDLSYTGNLLSMLFKATELRYRPDPRLERALDVLFILHADHEQSCSTNALRCVASSGSDPYSAIAAAVAALHGPWHGGPNEAVMTLLEEIGAPARVPEALRKVKAGERPLVGFGHRLYRHYDPRVRVIKRLVSEVAEVTGKNPLVDVAIELERLVMEDDYFVSQRLYPNLDLYSGLLYQAIGLPATMFRVLFAIPRTAGWLAHWAEMLRDPDQTMARPRQIYDGETLRSYVPMADRPEPVMREDAVSTMI